MAPESASAHHDPLIPGDAMLLDLLRAGTADAETAVRLGLSIGQVRMRVERLMEASGAASRAQLRTWEPGVAFAPMPPNDDEPGTTTVAPPPAPARLPLLGIAGGLAALAAVGALGWWALSRGDAEHPVAPTLPHPGHAIDTVVPPPAPTAPVGVGTIAIPVSLDVRPGGALRGGLVLFLLATCDDCAGSETLQRVYRDPKGAVRVDELFRAPPGQTLTSAWGSDGSDLVVTVCARGVCPGALGGAPSADAITTVHRSRDGGATWAIVADLRGAAEAIGADAAGQVLVRRRLVSPEPGEAAIDRYEFVPSGRVVGRPGEAMAGREPSVLADGLIAWPTTGRDIFATPDGSFAIPSLTEELGGLAKIVPRPRYFDAYMLAWYPPTQHPNPNQGMMRIAEVSNEGDVFSVVTYIGGPLIMGPWVDAHSVIATIERDPSGIGQPGDPRASFASLPAVLDFRDGTLTPLADPFTAAPFGGRKVQVVAAMSGMIVHVREDAPCATVLTQPGVVTGRPAGCLEPGTVVRVIDVQGPNGGGSWVRIRIPGTDRFGWLPSIVADVELLAP